MPKLKIGDWVRVKTGNLRSAAGISFVLGMEKYQGKKYKIERIDEDGDYGLEGVHNYFWHSLNLDFAKIISNKEPYF